VESSKLRYFDSFEFFDLWEYVDKGAAFYELKHRELQVHQLKWKAAGPKSSDANNV